MLRRLDASETQVDKTLTKASAVANPIPLRFTPVTSTVLSRTRPANASATSMPSVTLLKLGWVVVVMLSSFYGLDMS